MAFEQRTDQEFSYVVHDQTNNLKLKLDCVVTVPGKIAYKCHMYFVLDAHNPSALFTLEEELLLRKMIINMYKSVQDFRHDTPLLIKAKSTKSHSKKMNFDGLRVDCRVKSPSGKMTMMKAHSAFDYSEGEQRKNKYDKASFGLREQNVNQEEDFKTYSTPNPYNSRGRGYAHSKENIYLAEPRTADSRRTEFLPKPIHQDHGSRSTLYSNKPSIKNRLGETPNFLQHPNSQTPIYLPKPPLVHSQSLPISQHPSSVMPSSDPDQMSVNKYLEVMPSSSAKHLPTSLIKKNKSPFTTTLNQ